MKKKKRHLVYKNGRIKGVSFIVFKNKSKRKKWEK